VSDSRQAAKAPSPLPFHTPNQTPSPPPHPPQAAVPKYMQLKLEPASASTIPGMGGGAVQQRMQLVNTMHGSKPIAMRLRLAYSVAGQQVLEQAEVTGFPAGL